jgi:4a-hydroxytetrahydrobiopterin dehydratase
MAKLIDAAGEELSRLPGWRFDAQRNCIERDFAFKDFAQAFGFMTQIALRAERLNHHPEWTNVYNKVRIRWTTHDAGGVTVKDVELALHCDQLAGDIGAGGRD